MHIDLNVKKGKENVFGQNEYIKILVLIPLGMNWNIQDKIFARWGYQIHAIDWSDKLTGNSN